MGWIKKIILYGKYKNKKFLHLGKDIDLKHISTKFIRSENIYIGDFSKIGEYGYLDGSGSIRIENCTIIGPYITIITANHQYENSNYLPYNNTMIRKKVVIGSYCWIGRNVMIMPGITIGKASVIAAGSVVTKDIEAYSIAGGNPAKVIKKRDKEIVNRLIKEKNVSPIEKSI